MPIVTVQNVINECRALLNDSGGVLFTDTLMIPLIDKAYRELQKAYADNGIQVIDEISASVSVSANVTFVDPQLAFPSEEFLLPIFIQERPSGSTSEDDWVDMDERAWEPSESRQTTLDVWTWREQQIKLRGATVAREIKVRYLKALVALSAVGDILGIEGSQEFLASRASAIAAAVIGENMTRAEMLQEDATAAKEVLLSINAKKRQNIPIRRKRYRRPRNNWLRN